MNDINLWDENLGYTYYYDINNIAYLIKNKRITYDFSLKDKYIAGDEPNTPIEQEALQRNKNLIYTDEDHPICIGMFDSYMNKDFFEKNKARLINAITERIVNDDFSVIVHDYIFSKDFLVKLAKNYNGQTVYFCNIKLSKEDINFLRENHIEAFEKTEHENRKVSTKYAYDYITFEKLKETNELNIYTDISS